MKNTKLVKVTRTDGTVEEIEQDRKQVAKTVAKGVRRRKSDLQRKRRAEANGSLVRSHAGENG